MGDYSTFDEVSDWYADRALPDNLDHLDAGDEDAHPNDRWVNCPKCDTPMFEHGTGMHSRGVTFWDCPNEGCGYEGHRTATQHWASLSESAPGYEPPEEGQYYCPHCGGRNLSPATSNSLHCWDCDKSTWLHEAPQHSELQPHPDPWMDNEPGSVTIPQHWGARPSPEVRLGPVEASWEQIDPGVALIRVEGGSVADRALVHDLLRVQLAHNGIEQAQFSIGEDDEFRKTAHWRDLMAKAKRLIDSGQVKIINNTRNIVAGHVIGDHGQYDSEFSRDDPNSWSITMWRCECPWAQYAWQRTRQWKKYEGRVCAHVLALFWFSRRHPLDEDITPGGPSAPRGMKGFPGAPAPAPGPAPMAPGQPQQALGPDPGMGQPTPSPAAMPPGAVPPPPGLGAIPPQPMLPGALPPYVPGSTPNGMQAPPNAVSVPGARIPTPANPGQYPGGTLSHAPSKPPHYRVQSEPGAEKCGTCTMFDGGKCWGYGSTPVAADGICDSYNRDGRKTAASQFENGAKVKLLNSEWGVAEGRSEEHGSGQYREVPQGSHGEVMGQDATTGWVEVIFPLDTGGPMEPYHVRSFVEPQNLKVVGTPPGSPFIKRVGPHSGTIGSMDTFVKRAGIEVRPWAPGLPGKFGIDADGTFHHWQTNDEGSPHHVDAAEHFGFKSVIDGEIAPNGKWWVTAREPGPDHNALIEKAISQATEHGMEYADRYMGRAASPG